MGVEVRALLVLILGCVWASAVESILHRVKHPASLHF